MRVKGRRRVRVRVRVKVRVRLRVAEGGLRDERRELTLTLALTLPLTRCARVELAEPKAGGGGLFGGKATAASVDLVATMDLAAGAEVCVRYGGETAGDLLLDYGFADSRAVPLASL